MFEIMQPKSVEMARWRSLIHGPKPQPSNLYFGTDWRRHDWIQGKFWQITDTVVVPFDVGRIIPNGGRSYLNLSNADGALKLYPHTKGIIYEILVGLKPGAFQMGIFTPGPANFLLGLGDSLMTPDVTDAERRYLGAFTNADTPYENPLLKLWAIQDMDAWILQLFVEGVDFEHVILGFRVAKHRVTEIEQPAVFTHVHHADTIKGTW